MPKLKRVYDKSYMVISNHVFEDPNLTLKAKGLFGYLWSRPDDWNFFITELVRHFKGGRDQAMSALDELEKAGYLLRSRVRNELGQLTNKSTWLLSDTPKKTWIEQKRKSAAKKKTVVKKQVQKSASKKPVDKSTKPKSDFPTQAYPTLDKTTLLNTDLTKYSYNKILNNFIYTSSSNSSSTTQNQVNHEDEEEKINQTMSKLFESIRFYDKFYGTHNRPNLRQLRQIRTRVVRLQESNRDELCKAYDERIRNLYVNSPIGYLITMLNQELKDQEIWDKEAVTDAEN